MAWLDDYFARIEYGGSTAPSFETLSALHTAHVFHVPFENLNIHMGRPITLDAESLINKLIYERRGGYCFEMNGLFSLVLETLGFKFDRLLARILYGAAELRPRTHQLSLVYFDNQRWIADVGYGTRSVISPLRLDDVSANGYSRVVQSDVRNFILQSHIANRWQDMYTFTLEPQLPIDYVPVNFYTSTSPDSRFVQRRIVSLPTTNGIVSMTDDVLKITTNEVTTEIRAESLAHYLNLLETHFGICLTVNDITCPAPG